MSIPLLLAFLMIQVPDSSAALSERVEIIRTEYGVPHIMAEDLKAMGFGLAYVQSEDFGASVAIGFVQSRGTLARHEGAEELDADFISRGTHARAVETFHRLDPRARAVYEGFAQGLNHYVRLHPEEFPSWLTPDFTGVDAHARDVQSWSRGDAARFVRAMVSAAETPPGGGDAAASPAADEATLAAAAEEESAAFALDGSNAWAFDGTRTASGSAILLRNPHLTWGRNEPLLTRLLGSTYYEAHVRVPGVLEFYGDFRIGGAFGIIGGFSRYLGWATTNNYPRYSQVYALQAHPTLANHAVLDGRPLALAERSLTVDYRTEDGDVATETRSTWWTEYGPVIFRTSDRIYVLKDPRDGEFRRGEQFLRMMLSQSLEEWLDVMHLRAHPSSNFTYADADGNIVHYYNARLPRLPHEMTGDTAAFASSSTDIWSELVPWDDLPLYLNPPGGYVQQANDTPDYTNLNVPLDRDTVAANLPDRRLRLRSQLSLDLVGNGEVFSLEDLIELKHSPRMLMAERVLDDLLSAGRAVGDPDLGRALEILSAWDRTAAAQSRGGVLFKRWAQTYFANPDTSAIWREAWDSARPATTPFGLGSEVDGVQALRDAVESLDAEGIDIDARWGDVHRVIRGEVDEPVSGCEPTLGCFRALSYQRVEPGRYAANRGDAWVSLVEFGDVPKAYTVLAYGETARDGSPHFDDQAALFARGEMKRVAWTDEDISRVTLQRYRPGDFDLILSGGTVVDGTGAPGFVADVGVLDGRITEVGDLSDRDAVERMDVSGLVVSPGFIDPHTHSRGNIFDIPTADNFILQGVTTLTEGNDGGSPLDLGVFFDSIKASGGTAPNFAMFIGHGTIRSEVVGNEDRAPTPEEFDRMRALVARGMSDGALGLSTGLFYLPGTFAETAEVINLARIAAGAGGIYISHMRNEDVNVLESVRETIEIGREAGIAVQMTHHKVGGHRNYGRSVESIEMMRAARAEGIDITFDQYPYTASSTGLSSIIPRWAQAGGRLSERLGDPADHARIVNDIKAFVEMRFADDPSRIQLVSCGFDEEAARAFPDEMAGLTLADVFESRGDAPTPDAIAALILEIDQAGRCSAIYHAFDEGDVEEFMQSEYGMIGSDGRLSHFGEASPHPRGYGTFPRVLGRYVRERGVISLEEAVRRMTSAPADRLGFTTRGRIEVGKVADITVFDPETVIDQATFADPHQYPVGIPHVFVGGVSVVKDGEVTGQRPGHVLRGPGHRPGG